MIDAAAAAERRESAVEFAARFIRDSKQAPDRNAIFHALRDRFGAEWPTVGRTQYYRWITAARTQIAQHCAEDSPRDVDAARRAMMARHEQMSCTLEAALYKLVPSDPDELQIAARTEDFTKDVEVACKVSRSVIEHDKLRAHLLRLGDFAPDVAAVSAEARERNVKLIEQAMVDMSTEQRERIIAAADRGHAEAETDALSILGDPNERA